MDAHSEETSVPEDRLPPHRAVQLIAVLAILCWGLVGFIAYLLWRAVVG